MRFFFGFILFVSHFASAQHIGGEIELAGFVLGQYREAVHRELGTPITKRVTEDKWIYEFHKLKPDTSVYALFKYPAWDTTRIYSIQVSGESYPEMHSFRGLKLGDDAKMIEPVFGKYDHLKQVEDPQLTIQYYARKNYSFDIDTKGRIYGIQIFGDIMANKAESKPSITRFKNAVVSKNIDSLMRYIAPDIEIYSAGKVIPYGGAARSEYSKKDNEFYKHLLGEQNSLWHVFAIERAEGKLDVRLDHKTNNQHYVQNFFDSSIIREIVYTRHAGDWKIFEVRFR